MRLKEKIMQYEQFGIDFDDISLITQWAIEEHKEPELISAIGALAQSVAQNARDEKARVKEWSYYAYNALVPAITADTDFTTCINCIRLADMAFDNRFFVKAIDDIMSSTHITYDNLKAMHPVIYRKYEELKNEHWD